MTTNTLLMLQSILVTGQIINGGIAAITHNAMVVLIGGAVIGGLQFYVQHVGNQTKPQEKPDAA